jgi:hypothetical protein
MRATCVRLGLPELIILTILSYNPWSYLLCNYLFSLSLHLPDVPISVKSFPLSVCDQVSHPLRHTNAVHIPVFILTCRVALGLSIEPVAERASAVMQRVHSTNWLLLVHTSTFKGTEICIPPPDPRREVIITDISP